MLFEPNRAMDRTGQRLFDDMPFEIKVDTPVMEFLMGLP